MLDEAGHPRGADGVRFETDIMSFDRYDVDYVQLVAFILEKDWR